MAENKTNIKVYYQNNLMCTLYDEDFEENSLGVSGSALGSSGFNIGGATSNQASITITKEGLKKLKEKNALRRKARFDIVTYETPDNKVFNKYELGSYYVTELEVGDYSADLVMYDGMICFDEKISEAGLAELRTNAKTISEWVTWTISMCSSPYYAISKDDSSINTSMLNGGIAFKIAGDSRIDTYRNLLEFLSVLACGYFKINTQNKIYFSSFVNAKHTRSITSDAVSNYTEDAYPSVIEKLETSLASFDYVKRADTLPADCDKLTIALYENPFLRSMVTKDDTDIPENVRNILDSIANKVVGIKLSGGSVNYTSSNGILGNFGETIGVSRKVIPYGGEYASETVDSEILVTDFNYEYKNGITLTCNASVSNVNPSSSGLNKGVGYTPGEDGFDERLDEIADNLEKKSVRVTATFEKSFYDIVQEARNNEEVFWTTGFIDLSELPAWASENTIKVNVNKLDITEYLVCGDTKHVSKKMLPLDDRVASLVNPSLSNYGGFIQCRSESTPSQHGRYGIQCISYDDKGNKLSHFGRDITTGEENTKVLEYPLKGNNKEDKIAYYLWSNCMVCDSPVLSSYVVPDSNPIAYYRRLEIISDITSELKRDLANIGIGATGKESYSLPTNLLDIDSNARKIKLGLRIRHAVSETKPLTHSVWEAFGISLKTMAKVTGYYEQAGPDKPSKFVATYSLSGDKTEKYTDEEENFIEYVAKNSKLRISVDFDITRYIVDDTRRINENTVDIITKRIQDSSSKVDISIINEDIKYLQKTIIDLSNTVSSLESQNLYDNITDVKGTVETLSTLVSEIEKRVKALEDSGGTSQGVQDSIKDIYSKIATINSDILELSTRLDSLSHVSNDLKKLETRVSKLEQAQQEPTKSTGVNIAHYFNSNSVGVSANSTAFATFKIETSDDSSPLIQVSANANASQLGTLVFKVFYDGSEMAFKPKILMTKATEFITFSVPILEIIKGKIATLAIICETEDASVNFDVNNIAISVIGAKLYKGSTSFSESVPLFSINDTNIMLNSITESVKTSLQKIKLVEKTFSESVPLFSINDTNIMLNSITESAETTKPTK